MRWAGLVSLAAIAALVSSWACAEEPQQTTATYRDWTVRCAVLPGNDKTRSCEMVQAAHVQGQPTPISQIALTAPAKGRPLKLVVEVPAGVWLPSGVKVSVDPSMTIEPSFKRCAQAACFADAELKDDVVKKMRTTGQDGAISFRDGNQREIKLPLSFKGFGEAFDALAKL